MTRRHLVASALGLVAAVLGLMLVERLGTTYADGLDVTVEAAELTVVGRESARSLAEEVAGLAATTAVVVDRAGDVVRKGAGTTADTATALRTNLADGVDGTAGVADGLAGFIEFVERLMPGNRDSLAEDLRLVADGLQPLPGQLRALGDDLAITADRLVDVAPAIDDAAVRLEGVARRLDTALVTLDDAVVLAEASLDRALQARDRADGDLWIARILVVLFVVAFWALAVSGRRAPYSANEPT